MKATGKHTAERPAPQGILAPERVEEISALPAGTCIAPTGTGAMRRTAVIVCHGMGQQVPYETLHQAVDAVRRGSSASAPPETPPPVAVQQVVIGEKSLGRIEMTLEGRQVHFYEAYWAPLTEGQATLKDAANFLWSAGAGGLLSALRSGTFDRWMFGRRVALGKKDRVTTALALLLAVLVLASLFIINSAITAVGGSKAIMTLQGSGKPLADPLVYALTSDLRWLLAWVAGLFGVGIVLPHLLHAYTRCRMPSWLAQCFNITAIAGLLTVIFFGGQVGWTLVHRSDLTTPHIDAWCTVVVWTVVLVASADIKNWLLQYIGDVAIYVSSHTVNRFDQTRDKIKAVGKSVFCAVYGAVEQVDHRYRWVYDDVIVVGHSLGSVLAYDSYNAAVIQDALAHGRMSVPARTRLFLTFGSPLDKTAYLFRIQLGPDQIDREMLASSVQPMIVDSRLRPQEWINVYSDCDWISGDLNFYGRGIENRKDPRGFVPVASHSDYWGNEEVPRILYEALTNEHPRCRAHPAGK